MYYIDYVDYLHLLKNNEHIELLKQTIKKIEIDQIQYMKKEYIEILLHDLLENEEEEIYHKLIKDITSIKNA